MRLLRRAAFGFLAALPAAAPISRLRNLGATPRHITPAETLAFLFAEKADFGAIACAGKIEVE